MKENIPLAKRFKKTLAFLLMLIMLLTCIPLYGCQQKETLNILNWGDYIDPDLIEQFEEEFNVSVKYDTMANNEEMLIKLSANNCIYDLCFPSDYIIEKLVNNNSLYEINKNNIPNLKNIDERFLNLAFDEGNKYSVPYMWGTLGILYNTKKVSEPVDSWGILWDKKYAGQVLMYDSMRDSMAAALIYSGFSVNTRDEKEIEAARDALIAQKNDGIVSAYLGDSIKDAMIGNEGALAIVYSGDAVWCCDPEEGNADLAYAVPKEGSNIWFDNAVIPKTSKNAELAEKFIDFLCRPEVAMQNSQYIGYSTPNKAALALMDDSWINNQTYNPPQDVVSRCEIFHDLGDFTETFSAAWDAVIY